MTRKFVVGLMAILAITTLLFTGCSNGGNSEGNKTSANIKANTQETASNSAAEKDSNTNNSSIIKKNLKNITDTDLMSSVKEDNSAVLDSADGVEQQLSDDEIDTLLNDYSGVQNISTNFTAE